MNKVDHGVDRIDACEVTLITVGHINRFFTYLLTVSWPSSSVTNKLTNKHTNTQLYTLVQI